MKKIAVLFIVSLGLNQVVAQSKWNIDKTHSGITFSITHMLISEVEGNFTEFEGTVSADNEDFAGAEVNFTAQAASINTGNDRRDGHLRSDDFFNAESFPEVKFGGKIEKEGEKYYLVGDFTMRDVTKPIKFDVKYNGTINGGRGKKAGFKVTGTIKRFDYGIKFNRAMEAGGLVVSDEVEITCNVELNEASE